MKDKETIFLYVIEKGKTSSAVSRFVYNAFSPNLKELLKTRHDIELGEMICFGKEIILERGVKIGSHSILGDEVQIGENTELLGEGVTVLWGTKIGKNVQIKDSYLENDVTLGDSVKIGSGCFICRKVQIGEQSEIGEKVTIEPEVTLGRNTILREGSLLKTGTFLSDYSKV